jgi:glycosyltransferase involved in cell wall biosynthesis
MKILLTTGIYPPEIGGPATYIPQLADYLVKSGHEVTVLTLQKRGVSKLKSNAWQVDYVPEISILLIRMCITFIRILVLARKHDYVFSNGLYIETGLAIGLVKRPSVVKVVGSPIWERKRNNQQTQNRQFEANSRTLTKKERLQSRVLVFALNRFRFVTCPSQALCEEVWGWGLSDKPIFIPNGVVLRKPVQLTKDIDVITVSRLVNWKNIDVLIKSCAHLGVKLWIIGDGPEMGNLKKLANSLKAEVLFQGERPPDEIPKYLDRSRCFVLISDYEGLSFSLLEAMNCRIPVIVSDVPGNRSVVRSNRYGEVVNLISPKEVSEKILKILGSDNSKMVDNAYALVRQEYNLQDNFGKIMELFAAR